MPIWTRNPPCKAHVILCKMFESQNISPDSTAAATYPLNPEFLKFSLPVFREAFNEIRKNWI